MTLLTPINDYAPRSRAINLETRAFTVRAAEDPVERTFTGLAVPWDTPVDIAGLYRESFERGSVSLPASGRVLVYWRHSEPIGVVTAERDTDGGWEITGKLSDTERGREAHTLLRDGVIDELSIGFLPIEHREDDETGDITRTRVEAREVSLVPFGAYGRDALITDVRSADTSITITERATMPETDNTAAEITEIRAAIDEIDRKVSTLNVREDDAPSADTRSAGEILKAIASGDESTIRAYEALYEERAYTGGTSADAIVKPEGIVNLVRIFDASSGVLADTFSTGTLPASGNSIEFAEIASNSIDVTEQAAEGDDITFGKVGITSRTAPVKTYAGGTELTRQSIERSSVSVLNTSLEALATAAGARKKAVLRTAFNSLVTARRAIAADAGVVTLGATLAAGTAGNWEDALIDAALKFEVENLTPEALIVSGTVFKKLRSLTVAGERVFRVGEKNNSGTLDLPGLAGDFAGIPVRLDSGQTGDSAVFVNGRAIRAYDSALVSLTDENIVNLSKAFAVYRYGAVAAEIPAAVVPVKLAAA
ncbi:HK97 family phage prohead protease [Microbacterium sp. ZKA21]|uniref:HK97 family phage prohead protease n=1 Tax=Microbacterium sp. ZKA21 TaxID=3381694 RepID=UPI003D233983